MEIRAKAVSPKKVQQDAENNFRNGFFCCEALVAAIRSNFDLDVPEEVISFASGMAVGIGRSGCTCGALNGGVMALGMLGNGNGKTKVKNHLLPGLIPAVIAAALTILGIGSTGLAGFLIVVMIPVTILCARILWKKGIVKVVPVEQKETAASAQD